MEELSESQARVDLQRLLAWIQDRDPSFTGIVYDSNNEPHEFVTYHIDKIKHEHAGVWQPVRAERYVLLLTARMRMKYELEDGFAQSALANN
jgi:hypothetical protein